MTENDLTTKGYVRLPNGQYYKDPNVRANDPRSSAKLERNLGDGTLAKVEVQRGLGRRFRVCVTAVRKRLLDDDNACEKYHVDLLRHAGVIPGDSPATTRIQTAQRKCEPGEAEHILLEVFED